MGVLTPAMVARHPLAVRALSVDLMVGGLTPKAVTEACTHKLIHLIGADLGPEDGSAREAGG
ncbi:hypothetical protein [Rhizobacter sp. LjRoot28]|uniref:hypothetical protein n=1 Tax=Rhizobacter sp. LjRoot28 TaxID=3342309 RepID=UPI003F4F61FD